MRWGRRRKKDFNLYLILYTKVNSKCTIDLNVKVKIIKLIKNIGSFSSWFRQKERFLNYDTKSMINKKKIDKLDFTTIMNFSTKFTDNKKASHELEDSICKLHI